MAGAGQNVCEKINYILFNSGFEIEMDLFNLNLKLQIILI